MAEYDHTTLPGMGHAGQQPGQVFIVRNDGDNVVKLDVRDADGGRAVVWLGWHDIARLMMALGAEGQHC